MMNRPSLSPTASSPAELVAEALAVIERLAELLGQETARLRQTSRPMSPSLLDPALTADKSRLVLRYESLMQALLQHPQDRVRDCPGYDRLGPSVVRLQGLAAENAQTIQRHIRATKHVLEIIARAARKAAQPNFSYGTSRTGYGVRSDRQAAVAINRVS